MGNAVLTVRRWRVQRRIGIVLTVAWFVTSALWGGFVGFLMFDSKQ